MTEKKLNYIEKCLGKKIQISFIGECFSVSGVLRSYTDKELCLDTKNDEVLIINRKNIAYYKKIEE